MPCIVIHSIINDFSEDDQENDATIANLSVQILTVPSVAQHLIEKYNAFHNLVEYFLNIFQDEAQYNDEKLDLTEWMDDRPMYYRRCNHIINDIGKKSRSYRVPQLKLYNSRSLFFHLINYFLMFNTFNIRFNILQTWKFYDITSFFRLRYARNFFTFH